jgi:hypothetical protein
MNFRFLKKTAGQTTLRNLIAIAAIHSMFYTCMHCTFQNSVYGQLSQSRSRSHVTTDGQSVNMSRHRAHYETCDQILLSARRLLSESCCLVSVGRPLWREVGSVICHSQSTVIYNYLHQAFTLHVFYSSASYMQYTQSLIQSRLSTADIS